MTKRQTQLTREASKDSADEGTRWRDRVEAWRNEMNPVFRFWRDRLASATRAELRRK